MNINTSGVLGIWKRDTYEGNGAKHVEKVDSAVAVGVSSVAGGGVRSPAFERGLVVLCEFHGCIYPAMRKLVGKDYVFVCRRHEAFLKEEEGELVERAVIEELMSQKFRRDEASYKFEEGLGFTKGQRWSFPKHIDFTSRAKWIARRTQRRAEARLVERLELGMMQNFSLPILSKTALERPLVIPCVRRVTARTFTNSFAFVQEARFW